jgi:ubiquinone/menaquinone biosynthesis C-methylase UbiE
MSSPKMQRVVNPQWATTVRKNNPPATMEEYLQGWEEFFDHYAASVEKWHARNRGYHYSLESLVGFYVHTNARVLEIGSGTGDLLAAAKPSRGLGVDISGEMVRVAQRRHPDLEFRRLAAEHLDLGEEKFDYILLSDLTGFLFDIRLVFEQMRKVCHDGTRIVVNWYSRLWQPILLAVEKLGLKYPQPLLNWTTTDDIANLFHLAGFEVVRAEKHLLLPKRVPLLSGVVNRYLAHLPFLRHLDLTNWVIARPLDLPCSKATPSVSVICPCRNEAGNIRQIVERLPKMGSRTELIFVEGHSSDDTLEVCHRAAQANQDKNIVVLEQAGRGKGDAVRLGFSCSSGDILMILDADLSVAPEDLVQFYNALAGGKGDFVNGSRLVYAMDAKAMRFLNLLGNRFFALLLSKLIGQPIKDSLCGTKVLWSSKYKELARGRAYFGEIDPFGDFDLLFGAAKLGLKIIEVPIRYRQRIYGSTNINRFADGWLLLRMSAKAAKKLYFVA